MYGNFQYETIVWIFILSIGGRVVVHHFFVFLNNFFRIYALIVPCRSNNVLI